MRAVVSVSLTFPTKSIGESLTYKELPVRKFFIFVQRSFFTKFAIIRMRNTGVMDYQKKELGGHVSRRASSTCQTARHISKTTWSIIFLNWTRAALELYLPICKFFIPIVQKLMEKIATLCWRTPVSSMLPRRSE